MTLDRAFSVIMALWIDEMTGPLGDREPVRKHLKREFERIEAQFVPESWGASPEAAEGMAGMLAMAERARGRPSE